MSTVSITFRAVRACQNPTVCPVKKLFLYVLLAEAMRVTLRDGYLFRTSGSKGHIIHDVFQGSAVGNRFRRHFNTFNPVRRGNDAQFPLWLFHHTVAQRRLRH